MAGRKLSSRTAAALAVAAGLAVVPGGAAQAVDGPPTVDFNTPQTSPTAGGVAVRIDGSGLVGATSVKFGGINATSFTVVDSGIITAVVPAAAGGAGASNTFVDLTVTDADGTSTATGSLFYSNATLTATPDTGLTAGAAITVAVGAYTPLVKVVIPQANPLVAYVENDPLPPPPPDNPPYEVDPLDIGGQTNANGNKTVNTNLADPFNADGLASDPNVGCPVNQTTANYLGNSAPPALTKPSFAGRCLIVVTQFASGSIERPIAFTTEPPPGAPVLTTNKASAAQGEKVTITSGSVRWNANPYFGSSKSITGKPGQTKTTVQVCGIGGSPTACSTKKGTGTVAMTRYIGRVFSGATLSGNITVGSDVPDGCACFVRVRQNRPAGGFIEATAPLTVT